MSHKGKIPYSELREVKLICLKKHFSLLSMFWVVVFFFYLQNGPILIVHLFLFSSSVQRE